MYAQPCPSPRQGLTYYQIPCPAVFLISWTFAAWLVFTIVSHQRYLTNVATSSTARDLLPGSQQPEALLAPVSERFDSGPLPELDVFVGIQVRQSREPLVTVVSSRCCLHTLSAQHSEADHSWCRGLLQGG